jgi:type IV pilus secretin PilQ/predicted competence protein
MKKNITAVVQLLVLCLAVSSFAAIKGSGKKYDINFVNADFQSVFHSISKLAGVDILLAPEIQQGNQNLSIKVTKKTWPEMLDIICGLYDLTWLIEGNYISIQRTDSYQQKIKREYENRERIDEQAPLARRNFQIRHATAADMARVLDPIKSSRGRISVVERNNALIIYDTEKRLEQMKHTLEELDVETLQIVITAKLVVVNSQLVNDFGVDWAQVTAGTSRVQGDFLNESSKAGITTSAETVTETVNPAVQLKISAFDGKMQTTIANILSDSRTEVLASPQISTLDHTQATIVMGDQISIRVIDANGQSSNQMVESGIRLTVTPHVAGDNRIQLELEPQNNSYGYDDRGQVVISRQEAKTKVVVSDGETVVIGGLTRNDEIDAETGIPFLKDIPILGYLFKHTRKEITKRDLVIFVTPRIMRNYLSDKAPVAKKTEVYEDDDEYEYYYEYEDDDEYEYYYE